MNEKYFKEAMELAFEAGLDCGNAIEMNLKVVGFDEWYEKNRSKWIK